MLPRQNRITKEKEFERFFGLGFRKNGGKSVSTEAFVFKAMKNGLEVSRFGFIVGTKVDKRASVRNKVKRRMRAIVYSLLENIRQGFDFVIVAMKPSADLDFIAMEKTFDDFLKKVGVYKK